MNVLNWLFRRLAHLGCQHVFGVPGREAVAFEGLWTSGLQYIVCRHEQAAGFMAAGYGRACGRPGVCHTTFGPGVTNLVTSLADAYLDRVPLLAVCAQVELGRRRWGTHQYVDTGALCRPVSKAFWEVDRPEELEGLLEAAYRLAESEPPGPVVLSIPVDILAHEWRASGPQAAVAFLKTAPQESPPDPADLSAAEDLVRTAERPVALCGAGTARDRRTWEPLKRLVEIWGVPCLTTYAAKGVVSERSSWSLGPIGRYGSAVARERLESADLLAVIGYEEPEGGLELALRWAPDTTTLLIVGGNFQVPHGRVAARVAGPVASSLAALLAGIGGGDKARAFRHHAPAPWKPERSGFSALMAGLQSSRAHFPTLVCDVGMHKHLVALHYVAERPREIHFSSGLGCAGVAVPTAIGVCLALQGQPVGVVTGDGGFLMNAQDLETLTRLGLPVTVFLFEDGAFGLIEVFERESWGGVFGARFTNPDFRQLAASFGIESHRCQSLQEAEQFIVTLPPPCGPRIVIIPIDYSLEILSYVAN